MSLTPAIHFDGADVPRGGTPLPDRAQLGEYEICGVLHQGGFAIIYAAVNRVTGRKVAIKEYFPATLADRVADGSIHVRSLRHQQALRAGLQAFLDEARTLSRLDHPALVKVLDFWEQHATAYMAMPVYEGRTLQDVLRQAPKPDEAWLKAMIAPVLDALAALHAAGRFPRDVAPDNILILDDGAPLLLDFGAARRAIAGVANDVTVVLKPGYTPIEQYADDPSIPVGSWTDVYAVAAVLYSAITGKPPPAPATRIVSETKRPLGDLSSGYSQQFLGGIDRGLAVRPEDRPQTIMDFRTALGIGQSAPAPAPVPRETPRPGRTIDPVTTTVKPYVQESAKARVLGDGSKPLAPAAAQVWSPRPDQVPAAAPAGSVPRKLWLPLVAVVVVAVIALAIWMVGGPSTAPSEKAPVASTAKRIPDAQPGPPPAPTAPAAAISTPSTAPAPSATSAPPATAVADGTVPPQAAPGPSTRSSPTGAGSVAATARPPAIQAGAPAGAGDSSRAGAVERPPTGSPTAERAPAATSPPASVAPGAPPSAPSPAPAPRMGKIQFSIKPWGEIVIDGRPRGVSPPIKELSLPEGRHRVEIRNSTFPRYASDVQVKAGASVSITHAFKAP
jgi:non-specific serine/threonine protein kinase